jgi:uncharacterized protein
MRYWDTSALVALIVDEVSRRDVHEWYAADPVIATWWLTQVECVSAVSRLERDGVLIGSELERVLERLDLLAAAAQEVEPTPAVRRTAMRLLRVHPLRAADALQLAAATALAEDHPRSVEFITFDERLASAARREGFMVSGA